MQQYTSEIKIRRNANCVEVEMTKFRHETGHQRKELVHAPLENTGQKLDYIHHSCKNEGVEIRRTFAFVLNGRS